jgi:hypothetical protein
MDERAPSRRAETGWTTALTEGVLLKEGLDSFADLPVTRTNFHSSFARAPFVYCSSGSGVTRSATRGPELGRPRGMLMKTNSAQHFCQGRVTGSFALVVALLFLTACATQGDQARTEGTLAGAGIGAAVGAGLGYLIGRDGTAAAVGAAVGAALGGAGGYVYADRIAKRHEALAGKENDLDARIAFARGVNEDTQQYNKRLQNEVAELEPRISDLEARTQRQQITQAELAKQKQALGTRINDANKQLALAQDELQGLKKFRDEQKNASRELDEQIVRLEANLAQMRASTTALASLNQRI